MSLPMPESSDCCIGRSRWPRWRGSSVIWPVWQTGFLHRFLDKAKSVFKAVNELKGLEGLPWSATCLWLAGLTIGVRFATRSARNRDS